MRPGRTTRNYERLQGTRGSPIRPALGSKKLRKVRGPTLDTFYPKPHQCGDEPA